MFTVWMGRPETIKVSKDPEVDPYKGGTQWERHLGSKAISEEEEEEEEDAK